MPVELYLDCSEMCISFDFSMYVKESHAVDFMADGVHCLHFDATFYRTCACLQSMISLIFEM